MLIYSHNPFSAGARALANALNIKRIRHNRERLVPTGTVVINWGESQPVPVLRNARLINTHEAVNMAACKRLFFQAMEGANLTPWFTTDLPTASERMRTKGRAMVCRTVLRGHSGQGIVIADEPGQLVPAPLYTEYTKKKEEYRIHIINNTILDMQKKARILEVDTPNWRIRNHDNGFIYARNNIDIPQAVQAAALACMARTPLHFGAVDVIWSGRKSYVLEINTAPGLEGQTVTNYAAGFREAYM